MIFEFHRLFLKNTLIVIYDHGFASGRLMTLLSRAVIILQTKVLTLIEDQFFGIIHQLHISLLRDQTCNVLCQVRLTQLFSNLFDFGDRVVADYLAILVCDKKRTSTDIMNCAIVKIDTNDVTCLCASK